MNTFRAAKALAALLPLTLVAAACGGDDDAETVAVASDPASTNPAGTDTPATATPATAAPADTPPATDAPAGTTPSTAPADTFPVTIEHKYGETTIGAQPERIVVVGFAEHEALLAIGGEPVAVRDWYGDQPYATWPWAEDELGDLTPEVIPADGLNFEQIAALQPDVILGILSGMTDADYATLSAIAPTIAQPGDYVDYGVPWDVTLEITGRAVGRSAEAATVIADTKAMFAEVRATHPDWEGRTASVAFVFESQPGAYSSQDVRPRFLEEIGLATPESFDELAGDQFYFSVSGEQIDAIDADVVIWLASSEASVTEVRELPLRPTLTAYAEGREVLADPLLAGAFSHASPLSYPYVLEHLVPELELALDGDTATPVPSAAVLEPGYEPSVDGDDASAAADAWSLVFDSGVAFADKAANLEDAAALQATIEAYTAAGSAMGGITLVPTDVVVDGDTATITYDVMFGETVAYSALEGTIARIDGTWVVARDEFCGFMASARTACPA